MLDDQLLEDFTLAFYGYGTYRAPLWFVGMEEGGGASLEELRQRLAAWDRRGRRDLEDVADYHRSIDIDRHWREPVPLQRTWSKLIRVLLSFQGLAPTTQDVKAFQRDHLGREHSDTCLIELLPLPSPSTAQWRYSTFSTLPHLSNRQAYVGHLGHGRAEHIRARIAEHRPSAVVFYGLRYRQWWERIAGTDLLPGEFDGLRLGHQGVTTYLAMQHPVARGATTAYFDRVGQLLDAHT